MMLPFSHLNRILVFVLVLSTITTAAQTRSIKHSPRLAETRPEKVGMSSERLARLDTLLQGGVTAGEIPGVVALVARKGKIVYWKAFGMADNAGNRPLKRDDIFRIASQTKAVTATAVMMLWEEGKFRLDDPISKYIPEFKNPQLLDTFDAAQTNYTTVPAKSEITIRHLITHTSGIGYGFIDGDERFRKIYAKAGITDAFCAEPVILAENIKKLAKLPLHHNPGEKFTYSEGLDVLGYFIEIVSGMPFDKFLRERLLDPLGMKDTWFYLPREQAARLVPVQMPKDGAWVHQPVTSYDPEYPVKGARTFFAGGAGLSSTALDYATFLQMYVNGGELNGIRILSRKTVEAVLADQTGELMGGRNTERYYGLAFGVLTEIGRGKGGQGSAGTFDWGGYFNTQYFADPREQVVGVLMKQTQGTKADRTAEYFRQTVMQAIDD